MQHDTCLYTVYDYADLYEEITPLVDISAEMLVLHSAEEKRSAIIALQSKPLFLYTLVSDQHAVTGWNSGVQNYTTCDILSFITCVYLLPLYVLWVYA